MMPKSLHKLHSRLSHKQIVLNWIDEYRKSDRLLDQIRSTAIRGLHWPQNTLCTEIDAALGQPNCGGPFPNEREPVLTGPFLARLAMSCNYHLLATARERDLEALLCSTRLQLLGYELANRSWSDDDTVFADVIAGFRGNMRDLLEAVRLIERNHFDSAPVLFPAVEDRLTSLIAHLKFIMETVERLRSDAQGGVQAPSLAASADPEAVKAVAICIGASASTWLQMDQGESTGATRAFSQYMAYYGSIAD